MQRADMPYHLGIVVASLEDAMRVLSAARGIEWSDVHVRGPADMPVRVVCSRGTAPYLELLQGREGTRWHTTGTPQLHHLAYWCEDLEAASRELVGAGYEIEADFGHARYLTSPFSPRIELVSRSAWPALHRLFGID